MPDGGELDEARAGDRVVHVRADLPRVATRSLVLQCASDVIAPTQVGEYVHARLPDSELVHMAATGHCPNLSAPEETIAAIRAFLASP